MPDPTDSSLSQVEFSKKKDSELNKLRRDLDESGMKFGEALAALKKKGQDGAMEMNDQIEQVRHTQNFIILKFTS